MSYSQSMNQAQVNQTEEAIERQKSSHFRGRAKVPLEFLRFSEHSPRDLDQGNIQRLVRVYREEGVRRLQYEHYIPAVIGKDDLLSAVQLSGLLLVDLLNSSQSNPPRLTFPEGFRLTCLHGKHRIEAAQLSDCLRGEDKWWTVILYSEDLSTQAMRSLIEDYSGSQEFSDGMIFRKIVEYESSDDYSRQHWWSWLTDCKKDILGRIFAHTEYNSALRKLMLIPALLEDLKITVWHKIMATRSDEEFLHYISHILATFDHICGRQKRLWIALDSKTVADLQSRCPGTSLHDRNYLQTLMDKGKIFHAVNHNTRQEIWTRLCEVKYLIPTLKSLQQDFKFIKGPAMAISRLLKPVKRRGQCRMTLRNIAELAFLKPRRHCKVTIETTDGSIQEMTGDVNDQFEIGFQQLYLFAMRESKNLVRDCPLKERTRKTPSAKSPDPIIWHDFARLAYILGFESPEVQRLRQMNPFEEKARQKLLDEEGWRCEDELTQRLLTEIANLYRMKSRNPSFVRHEPQMLTDGPGESVGRRQGRCYENAYDRDKQHMFIKTLSQPTKGCAESVTSLFVRKSVHQAFFPSCEIESGEPVVSEPNGGTNDNRAGEQSDDVKMPDVAVVNLGSPRGDDFDASPSRNDGTMAKGQNDDIDMPDAVAVSRSSSGGDNFGASSELDAGSTNTLQEDNLSASRGVKDDLAPISNNAGTSVTNQSIERRHSAASGSPASVLSPTSSLALQLINVDNDNNDQSWSRKRPRRNGNLQTIEGQNSTEHSSDGENQTVARRRSADSSLPTSVLPPASSLALQLINVDNDNNDPSWSRKRPRRNSNLQIIEGKNSIERINGSENQIAGEFLDVSFTPGKDTRKDAHAESSNSTEVTIWADFDDEEYKQLKDSKCNSIVEVLAFVEKLREKHHFYTSTSRGRAIMPSECYKLATSIGGDNRVYLTEEW